jgi:hypothetical protein
MKLLNGKEFVRKEALKHSCNIKKFDGNFNQMVNFGEKNHGKVFEVTGDEVRLWKEVAEFVMKEYELFDGTTNASEHSPITNLATKPAAEQMPLNKEQIKSEKNSRYGGRTIEKAQNLLVRNILSNLGKEIFNAGDWKATKAYFANRCAYCGAEGKLVIKHAIPINKEALGEHRLGNMVPSCENCNLAKASKNYKDFLGDNIGAINKIEKYMESRNYVPLGNNEQVKKILNMAYEEVATVADRYIAIINESFVSKLRKG